MTSYLQDGIEKLLADKDAECAQAMQLYQARYERDLELLKDELQEQELQLNNVANKLSDTEELLRASEQVPGLKLYKIRGFLAIMEYLYEDTE